MRTKKSVPLTFGDLAIGESFQWAGVENSPVKTKTGKNTYKAERIGKRSADLSDIVVRVQPSH